MSNCCNKAENLVQINFIVLRLFQRVINDCLKLLEFFLVHFQSRILVFLREVFSFVLLNVKQSVQVSEGVVEQLLT